MRGRPPRDDAAWLYTALHDAGLGHCCDDGVPGYVRPPEVVGMLAAIQHRFRALYFAWEQA